MTTAVVLTVAALIFVSVLPGQDNSQKIIENNAKLEKIDEARRGFMAANGRLPCPADGQYAVGSQYFGMEALFPGTCQGGKPQAPLGPDATGYLVAGTIPTRTLGLPDDYAFDAFGHRFTYIVDRRATANSSCLTMTISALTIKNTTSGTTLGNSIYAYISSKSGFGKWPMQGGTNRINTGNTDSDMDNNDGFNPGWLTTSSLVQKAMTPTFDDIVWYRPDLKGTCALGAFAAVGHCNTASPSGPLAPGFSPASLPGSGAGSTMPAFASNSGTCTSHTLTCSNGNLTCDGISTLTNCDYSSCSVTNCATASPAGPLASSFSPTSISPGPGVNAWPNSSDPTCTPSHTLTCSGGVLYCDGSTTLTNCEYSSCTTPPGCSTAGLGPGFSPASLPGSGAGSTMPAFASNSGTCTSHTLTCTNGNLTCDGSTTLTNCDYSSCTQECQLNANQSPPSGGILAGAAPGNTAGEYKGGVNINNRCPLPNTMTCTNGKLSCSDPTGSPINIANCQYSDCHAPSSGGGSPATSNIWVVDSVNHRVEKFGLLGDYQSQLDFVSGGKSGLIPSLYYIAFDSNNNIWMTDSNNEVDEIDDVGGSVITQFGAKGAGNGQFNTPQGIAVDANNNVWVVDSGNNRVEEFSYNTPNPTGGWQWQQTIPSSGCSPNPPPRSPACPAGSGTGQFNKPVGIAIDKNGNLWVTDQGNNRVQEFASNGGYQYRFSTKTGNAGSGPTGIATTTDTNGNVDLWVADPSIIGNQVFEFDTTGKLLTQVGWPGKQGSGASPAGIAVDSNNNVWVTYQSSDYVTEYDGQNGTNDGTYMTEFGSPGSSDGTFNGPVGVAAH